MRLHSMRSLLTLAIAPFFVVLATHARAATHYGDVDFVEGTAEIIDAKGKARASRTGEKIFEGETMRTGVDGEMHVKTSDHALVALRANTRIKIEIYRAEGDAEDTSVLSLVGGTLRSITGWIGKYHPNRYSLKTSNATLGIRGTDHEPLYVPPGEKSSVAPGTYDKVNAGSTFIETGAGRIAIEKGRAGFAPHDAKIPPKLLDRIPEVYRPTRNEERIRKRKDELEREIDTARLERQKARSREKAEQSESGASATMKKSESGVKAEKDNSPGAEPVKEEARKKAAEHKHRRTEGK